MAKEFGAGYWIARYDELYWKVLMVQIIILDIQK